MTSVSKNVYIDKLDDIVNKYNNAHHSTIKTKSIVVKSNIYIDSSKENNERDPKSESSNIIEISKYKNIFANGYTPNWSEEVFGIKKVRNTMPWTYVINGINGKKTVENFCKNELQKINQSMFKIEKVIKKKGNKLPVKWKGYNDLFNY